MTDLEINIALAKAMGWVELSVYEWVKASKTGFIFDKHGVVCSYEGYGYSKPFDYRDPVIFVAICKHWKLDINHLYGWVSGSKGVFINVGFGTIEKAAALCVIEMAKRGDK
jgi:hypothetical protein